MRIHPKDANKRVLFPTGLLMTLKEYVSTILISNILTNKGGGNRAHQLCMINPPTGGAKSDLPSLPFPKLFRKKEYPAFVLACMDALSI
jgi:hypothetical protein